MNKVKLLFVNNLHIFTITFAVIIGFVSLFHYFSTTENLMYGDARSHLNIARRVVDSTNPGAAQLGGIWLPLLHLLMLPTVVNDYMWHSGLSGAIVNFFSLIIATFFLFKIGELLFESKAIRIVIPFLYLLNPNILYMSTTAMTEVLFIATFTGAIFYLLKWVYQNKLIDLILCALCIFLTSINRYEGWTIVISSIVTVVLLSFAKRLPRKKIEGNFIVYSSLAGLGIFFWLIWNWTIFGDPFYFLNSIYSAKFQTQAGFQVVGTKSELLYRNIKLAPLAYFYAVIANTGVVITGLGVLGAITSLFLIFWDRIRHKKYYYLLVLFLLLTPFLFESYAIYKGNVPLHVPQINGGTFNIRLGMYVIPSVTILLLFFLKLIPYRTIVLLCVILLQAYLFYPTFTHPITLQAAGEGIEPKIETAKWFKAHYKGGNILASSATGDPLLFDSGLNLREFITDGSQDLFKSALQYPESKVRYIVLTNQPVDRQRDLVYRALSKNRGFRKHFTSVFNNSAFEIFENKSK